jgi:hypothetical protein
MNSNLIPETNRFPIEYRIIGRNAWKKGTREEPKPNMSWSVPFRWFWRMPKRLHKALMEPMPMDLPKENIDVLKDFQEGSSKS